MVELGSRKQDLNIVRNNICLKLILSSRNTIIIECFFEEVEFIEDAIHGLIITSYNYDFLKQSKDELK